MPFVYNKEKLEQKTEKPFNRVQEGENNRIMEEQKNGKTGKREEKHSFFASLGSFIWETIKVVIISLAIVIPIRYFIIQPFYVKGASMEPSFYDHEYLIIDEITYRLRGPERGEVVVFRSPPDPRQYFIKRAIALPGERIKIENKKIYIYNSENPEGIKLDENNYLPLVEIQGTLGQVEITLKDDEYFVLGDNRNSSMDSRSFGPITKDKIIGKAWLRGWPFDRFELFGRQIYVSL